MARYYEVFELFQCGGGIRRRSFPKDYYLLMELHDEEYIVFNSDGDVFELSLEDLQANDWEEYIEEPLVVSELNDKVYLAYVQTKAMSAVQSYARVLNTRLRFLAEREGSVVEWGSATIKYYIAYSYNANKYYVDTTSGHYYPSVVYFKDRDVAQKGIERYEDNMDKLRVIENIRGVLHNGELTREEMEQYERMLDDIKGW